MRNDLDNLKQNYGVPEPLLKQAYRGVAEAVRDAAKKDSMATDADLRDLLLNEICPVLVTKFTKNVANRKVEVSVGKFRYTLIERYLS